MCYNKNQRFEESTHQRSHKSCGFWGMPFLPFLIVSLFFFVPHLWTFAAHAWGWLLPVAIGSLFFAKFAGAGAPFRQGLKTKEEPSLPRPEGEYTQAYQQVYYQVPVQEMYQEGGRDFPYQGQEVQIQRPLYEEPSAQYPRNTLPIE
ncbi:MAG: hypothetical protein H0U76_10145 [Ktedonobacteraceae bacterium]|nr:hypothetical protein [Ktedonobacteraceae bacterium]